VTKHSYKIGVNSITITKGFMKNAAMLHTVEAQTLLYWKKVFPNHKIKVKAGNDNKQTHKQLTEAFMMRYINTRPQGEINANMIELNALKLQYTEIYVIEEGMTKSEIKEIKKKIKNNKLAVYTRTKSWFLDKYPDYSKTLAFTNYIQEKAALQASEQINADIEQAEVEQEVA